MTLQDAIAEVRRNSNLSLPQATIQQILNAVASGQLIPKADAGAASTGPFSSQPGEVPASSAPALIPKADADLAIAEALRKAADYVASCQTGGFYLWRHALPEDVLALADQDHLAEATALRDAARKYRASWQKEAERNNELLAAFAEDMARLKAAEAEVARLRGPLEKQANGGAPRKQCSYVGHKLEEGSWHIHLAGFCSKEDAIEAMIALLSVPALTRKGETI